MPYTPTFTCTQDDEFVYLSVRVPWVRVSNMEFLVDDCNFSFYCKPYLLKLVFPGKLIEDERCKAVYDVNKDNGTITCHLPKQEKGEEFKDLDLLTKLHAPSLRKKNGAHHTTPLIQVVGSSGDSSSDSESSDDGDQSAEEGTRGGGGGGAGKDAVPTIPLGVGVDAEGEELPSVILPSTVSYGFNNRFSKFFAAFRNDFPELVRVPDPDATPAKQRKQMQVSVRCIVGPICFW